MLISIVQTLCALRNNSALKSIPYTMQLIPMAKKLMYIMVRIFSVAVLLCHALSVSAQVVMGRDEAVGKRVLQINKVEAELLRYRNEQLAYDNMLKELLPAVSLTFSPLNFNHSMRLLQNPLNGDYYNVNDYTNTSVGGIAISQKVKATGGTFALRSSLSLLHDFSNNKTGVSSVPLYVSYNQPLFGGGKTARFEYGIQKLKVQFAEKRLCVTIAEAQREMSGLYMQALSQQTSVSVAQKAVDIDDTLVIVADARKRQGRITDNDYNLVKIQQLENIMNLKKAQHELEETVRRIKDALKCDSIVVGMPDYNILPVSLSADETIKHIMQNNPGCLSLQIENAQAEKDAHVIKTDTRFNADISVSYGLNQYASNIAGAYKNPDQAQGVSVVFRIPVFQWGINRNKRIMIENEHEAQKRELAQDIVDLQTSAHRMVFQYNYSREMIVISRERCEIAQKIYEQAATKFSLGKISALELTKANKDMFSAIGDFADCMQNLYECYFAIRSAALYDFVDRMPLEDLFMKII